MTFHRFSLLVLLALTIIGSSANADSIDHHQQRIISTDAGVTDVLFALGMGSSLVGIDATSMLPPEATNHQMANLGYHRMLPAEGVLSLNPDLIIGSTHMGPPETIEAIKKADLTLEQLPVAKDEKTLKENIVIISGLVAKQAKAQALLTHIDNTMAGVRQQQLPDDTKVAFLLQLEGRGLRLAGKNTTGEDIILLLGGNNIAEHNSYQSVSAEALLSLEPDVIIVAGRDASQSSVEVLLKNNPLLKHTPAAQQQKIIEVDGRLLVAGISLSAIDALATMAKTLH